MTGSPTTRPPRKAATVARIYDCYLGGIRNFAADRRAAEEVAAHLPAVPAAAQANRSFLTRATRYLVEEEHIRQFLDIGSGHPSQKNVHEIAGPKATVVYVDLDVTAVAEFVELLSGIDGVEAIRADVCNPGEILDHRRVRRLLDFTEPIGLLLAAVLQYVPNDVVHSVVSQLVDAMPSGTYVTLSHPAADAFPRQECDAALEVYRRAAGMSPTARSRDEISDFLTGLDLVNPGLVDASEWRPEGAALPRYSTDGSGHAMCWAAVGSKTCAKVDVGRSAGDCSVPREQAAPLDERIWRGVAD